MGQDSRTVTRRVKMMASRRGQVSVQAASPEDDPTLAELGIPAKYRGDLAGAGIERLSQLEAFGDLTAIKGIGPKGAEEIRSALTAIQNRRST